MRWSPLAVGLLFLAIAMVWLGQDTRFAEHAFGPGSSLSTAPEGLALARAYLAGQGREVGTLARSITRTEPTKAAVVFRVTPRTTRTLVLRDGGALDVVPGRLGRDGGTPDDEEEEEGGWASQGSDAGPGGVSADGGTLRTRAPPGLLSADEAHFVAAGGR